MNEITAQKQFEIDIILGQIILQCKIKELIEESVALNKLTDLENIPINSYINVVCQLSNYAQKARFYSDTVIQNARNILQAMKEESDIQNIIETFYFKKMCFIFNIYYSNNDVTKNIDNDNNDKNGIPEYFSLRLKNFIKNSYLIFQQIRSTKESNEFIDLIEADKNKYIDELTIYNCAFIFGKIFLGEIRSGRNITRLLFDELPQDTIIPDSFKKLCRIKNGKYIIFNTDWNTLDFQLAVFDLIEFVDCENKSLFNNKINQYSRFLK